ncbi:MAG: DNA alkylation repair protein [Clostridia bacterium]|nr:DNA alkylation repair protein [Clostridia bacterium]
MSEILQKLNGMADSGYAVFHSRIANTKKRILGVRMPDLRKISKTLCYDDVKNESTEIYETVMLQGLTMAKLSYEEIKNLIPTVVKNFDSWAFVDCVVPSCKSLKTNVERAQIELFEICNVTEFFKRFYIVFVMDFCPTSSYAMDKIKQIKTGEYYVDMAIAWYISVLFALDFKLALVYMQSFSPVIQKMAIRKGLDSFRLTKEQKIHLKSLNI